MFYPLPPQPAPRRAPRGAPRIVVPRMLESDDAGDLGRIHEPDVSAVIWRRARPPVHPRTGQGDDFVRYLRLTGDVAARFAEVDEALAMSGISDDELASDLVFLSSMYCSVTSRCGARLRLTRVAARRQERFHTDRLDLRLLCTYSGPGTELLPEGAARRSALGHRADAVVMRDRGELRALRAGEVALIKGERYGGRCAVGAIHRSPMVRAADEGRVHVCIDGGPSRLTPTEE